MIEFIQLDLTNFQVFRETQTIPLAKQGLVHIDGLNLDDKTTRGNGAGKSTIPEGLVWALYGKPIREMKTVDSVLHRWHKKDCEARVSFKRGVSSFVVARYRNHTKHRNRVYVFQDGNDITVKDDAQAQINDILGMDYDTFIRTAVFTKRDLKSLAALKHADQNALFENVLGVDAFAKAQKRASKLVATIDISLHKLNADLAVYVHRIESGKRVIKEMRKAREDFEKRKGDAIATLESELAAVKKKTNDAEISPGYSIKKLKRTTDALNEAKARAEDARDKCEERMREKVTAGLTQHATRQQLTTLEEETSDLFGFTSCPKCKRPYDDKHKRDTKREVKDLKRQLGEHTAAFIAANDAWLAAKEGLEVINKEIAKHEKTRIELRERKAKYEEWKTHASARASELRERHERLTKALEAEKATTWKGKRKLDKEKASIAKAQTKMDKVSRKLLVLKRRKSDVEFWVKGFGRTGIPTDLINSVIPTLTLKVNDYLERLSRGAFKVRFDTQRTLQSGETRDRFEVIVDNKHGAEEYGGNSTGELAKVDFAIALGFQALHSMNRAHAINVAFYDEVFDGADGVATDTIVELLTDIAKEKDSLFVMSHLEALRSSFPKTLVVEKKKHASTVRWE